MDGVCPGPGRGELRRRRRGDRGLPVAHLRWGLLARCVDDGAAHGRPVGRWRRADLAMGRACPRRRGVEVLEIADISHAWAYLQAVGDAIFGAASPKVAASAQLLEGRMYEQGGVPSSPRSPRASRRRTESRKPGASPGSTSPAAHGLPARRGARCPRRHGAVGNPRGKALIAAREGGRDTLGEERRPGHRRLAHAPSL